MPRVSDAISPLANWTSYLLARFASMGLAMFNPDSNLETAASIGRVMYRVDKRHRIRTIDHLRIAFPEQSREELEPLAERVMERLVQLAVEVFHTPRVINPDSWPDRISLGPMEPAMPLLNAGKPAILVTGHVGNWEVLGYFLSVLGYPCVAIARPFKQQLIYDWLIGIRERRGMRVISKWQATDQMIEVLSSGGMLGFIADQNAGDKGIFVPFFGKLASTYKSIGLLAIDRRVPVICGYSHRIGPGFRHETGVVDVIMPEDWESHPDPLFYVTARYMRAIEQMVRLRPEQYLWMHRRWKSRPRFEQQGKPMPAAMLRNLESLPWMDPATLARLQTPLNA